MTKIRAVIFDLGGVVLGSPLHAIAAYERELGLPANFVNRVVGEISARAMMQRMAEAARPRPAMLKAVARIREHGVAVAALTNNWSGGGETANGPSDGTHALRPHFDVFVESSVEGLRKPDPRIYQRVCARLDVPPHAAAFLDDIGANLKPARALGMKTIKVVAPEQALDELAALLGFDLD